MTVFICHASEDKPRARDLTRRLHERGYDTWLDEEQLLPGQHWETEISNAIFGAAAVLVCLTKTSTSKIGFVQKELRFALDVALHQPGGLYLHSAMHI